MTSQKQIESARQGEIGPRKEGGRKRKPRRAPRRQTGTDTMWLRCPRCNDVGMFALPVYKDGPAAWEQLPMLRCDNCQQLSATTAWRVLATAFEPLPA